MEEFYILENRVPRIATALEWAQRDKGACLIKREKVRACDICTVFTGMGNRVGKGPPLLWETMVFKENELIFQERCSGSWEQAEAMHGRAAALFKSARYDLYV